MAVKTYILTVLAGDLGDIPSDFAERARITRKDIEKYFEEMKIEGLIKKDLKVLMSSIVAISMCCISLFLYNILDDKKFLFR